MDIRRAVLDRFLRYVRINTQSKENSNTFPSTPGQLELAKQLAQELKEMGIEDAKVDENGYLTATLPANFETKLAIGFIAHLDTSPDAPATNVKPKVVKYTGHLIILNSELGITLSEEEFPVLKRYIGQELVVTDGTTLLGADDKAGIAEIMTAIEYLIKHPDIPRPNVKIAFTPDEEIGRGVERFNVKAFGARYAYTVDGGEIGSIEFETFNACNLTVKFKGVSVHPGYAKGIMRNAITMANCFINSLPPDQTPEVTDGYQGYIHVHSIKGGVEQVELKVLIRDHDYGAFNAKKELIRSIASMLETRFGKGTVQLEFKDIYYNMRQIIDKYPIVKDLAIQAIKEVGLEPKIVPVRGGTDGARLSFMGLPTPNLFTGGHNPHSVHEFIPVNSMVKAVEVIVKLCELWAEEAKKLCDKN